jgi:uncharacterized protein YuzE
MTRLIEVTRETESPHSMYLRYSKTAVTWTNALHPDGAVSVDYDANGEVVGIEIVAPDSQTVAIAAEFAVSQGLSLLGVFDPQTLAM